ncbi:hypothetical protein INT45_010043 [Circinella minor]|uniref:Uncharacterized protein n=1 Tax=Circinella minor TaxID=1195481 RepID=A0A8H7S9T0_9FUNG|nr:hypothetical protein INT45_010043 [Circinella minor]
MLNQVLTTHTIFKSYVQDCVDVEINPSLNEVLKMNEKTMIDYTDESDPRKFKEQMTSQFESICSPILKGTTLKADNCIASSTVEKIIQGALKKMLKNARKRVALKTRIVATHLLEIEIERSGERYETRFSKKPKLMNEDCNDNCNNNQPTDVDGDDDDDDDDVDSF